MWCVGSLTCSPNSVVGGSLLFTCHTTVNQSKRNQQIAVSHLQVSVVAGNEYPTVKSRVRRLYFLKAGCRSVLLNDHTQSQQTNKQVSTRNQQFTARGATKYYWFSLSVDVNYTNSVFYSDTKYRLQSSIATMSPSLGRSKRVSIMYSTEQRSYRLRLLMQLSHDTAIFATSRNLGQSRPQHTQNLRKQRLLNFKRIICQIIYFIMKIHCHSRYLIFCGVRQINCAVWIVGISHELTAHVTRRSLWSVTVLCESSSRKFQSSYQDLFRKPFQDYMCLLRLLRLSFL